MSFIRKLLSKLVPSLKEDVLWLYVQCNRCKKKLKIRINKNTELSPDYDESSGSGYLLNKDAQDDKCFTMMHIQIRFDSNKKIHSQNITGGKFITKGEFEKT